MTNQQLNSTTPHWETDVIIIGGGATGAGIARDCALRGLRCILLERLRDECKSYFARDAQSIHSEDSILVIDVLCCAMLSHSVVSNFL